MASNYPQIPCSKNPLRWHQPWLLNGTGHLREIKWWHLHHKFKENLGKFLLAAFTLISVENLTNVSVICMHAQSCPTFCDPWTIAHWAPLYMGFPQQEYWVVCHFPLQGNLPNSGTKPTSLVSPELAGRFFSTELPEKPVSVISSRNSPGKLCWSFLMDLELLLLLGASLWETSLIRSMQPRRAITSSACGFQGWPLASPGRGLVNLPPLLCETQTNTSLCGHRHPVQQGNAPGRSNGLDAAQKFCTCVTPVPVNTRGRSCPSSISIEILMKLRRKNVFPLKMPQPRRNFRENALL